MPMLRLYHRRSSACREKSSGVCSVRISPTNPRVQKLGSSRPRCSVGLLGTPRSRSLSLSPGSQMSNALEIPARSRSMSFSGDNGIRSTTVTVLSPVLTTSEEDHIFRCYARMMYMILGFLGAAVFGLILYTLHSTRAFNMY